MSSIPQNLFNLLTGENEIFNQSIDLIDQHPEFSDHLDIMERTMNLLNSFSTIQIEESDDGRTLQHLSIRLFNNFSSSWKLIASGYYQNAAMIQRDIIETSFLVDYFYHFPEKILPWRMADRKKLVNNFGPSQIRKALEKASGRGKSKREEIYQKFSNLAAHPSVKGFEMLKPKGSNAVIGPFIDEAALKGLLEESGFLAIQAGFAILLFVINDDHDRLESTKSFVSKAIYWSEKYTGIKFRDDEKLAFFSQL